MAESPPPTEGTIPTDADGYRICEKVGEAMPDIAGIGILVAFAVQALLSLLFSTWAFFLSRFGHLELRHEEGSEERAAERRRVEFVSDILMIGNDVQMLTGAGLMFTAFSQSKSIDVYHLRLVFETVCFVGVSNAAALVTWSYAASKLLPPGQKALKPERSIVPTFVTGLLEFTNRSLHRKQSSSASSIGSNTPQEVKETQKRLKKASPRYRATYVFALVFLALTIQLGTKLSEWDWESEQLGKCYNTDKTSTTAASHPFADKLYVGCTAGWMILCMLLAVFGGAKRAKPILILAFMQFPVHLYMLITLRTANQELLEGSENENDWDFGQTTAILLLGVTIREAVSKAVEYMKFEREIHHHMPDVALDHRHDDFVHKRSRGSASGHLSNTTSQQPVAQPLLPQVSPNSMAASQNMAERGGYP